MEENPRFQANTLFETKKKPGIKIPGLKKLFACKERLPFLHKCIHPLFLVFMRKTEGKRITLNTCPRFQIYIIPAIDC